MSPRATKSSVTGKCIAGQLQVELACSKIYYYNCFISSQA